VPGSRVVVRETPLELFAVLELVAPSEYVASQRDAEADMSPMCGQASPRRDDLALELDLAEIENPPCQVLQLLEFPQCLELVRHRGSSWRR
jgi:hypothetical protein